MHALYARAEFLCAAARDGQFPPDEGAEVAFGGRSNAGKSSAINAVTGTRALARTSRTPGRTRQINFFRLDDARRLVDLPGYGYAQAPAGARREWLQVVDQYLAARRSLRGVVLLMDVRRPFTSLDEVFFGQCIRAGRALCVVLTKADKLSRARAQDALAQARRRIEGAPLSPEVMLFSAARRSGVEELREHIARWLEWSAGAPAARRR